MRVEQLTQEKFMLMSTTNIKVNFNSGIYQQYCYYNFTLLHCTIKKLLQDFPFLKYSSPWSRFLVYIFAIYTVSL